MHQSSENSLMNDHLSYELLASYLFFYYKFTPKEKLYIQQHLTQCQECKKAFLSIVQFESDTSTSVVYSMRSSQKQGSIIFTNGNHKIALKADTDNILKDILIYPKSQNWFYIKIILIDCNRPADRIYSRKQLPCNIWTDYNNTSL